MMKFRILILTVIANVLPAAAFAQGSGQLGPGQFILNLNSSATGAATGAVFQTGASIGQANPIKYVGATGSSPLFGLPYSGYQSLVNFSGDGSFTANSQGSVHLYTWDRTSDHGTTFVNPQNLPLYDDSTWYEFGAQNMAFVSANQSVITGCNGTTGFTVSGGQITAVGTIPGVCASGGYVPNSAVAVQAYASPGF